MRKKSDSLRKTLAFTAAFVFISSSFTGYPVNYTSTVHADENGQSEPKPAEFTYTIDISNEDMNSAFSWVGYDNFVSEIFNGCDLTIDHTARTVTLSEPVSNLPERLYFGEKLYKLNSNMGGVITYDAYYRISDGISEDDRVSLNFDDYCHTDDGFCKGGSQIYITPNKLYSCNNADISARITCGSALDLAINEKKNDSFSVIVTDADGSEVYSCDFAPKTYNIAADSKLSVMFDGKDVSPDKLKWSELARISIGSDEVQALIISDGTNSRTVAPKEMPYYFFKAFENNILQSYVTDITYRIEAVTNAVKPTLLIDGKPDSDILPMLPIEKDSQGYFINLPYVIGSDCYLSSFTYGEDTEISASDVYDALAADKQYYRIKYTLGTELTLNYTSFASSDVADYSISSSIQKKSDNCYTAASFADGTELIDFSENSDNYLLILNHFDVAGGNYSLNADSMAIDAENRTFVTNSAEYGNARYIAAKNIIYLDKDNNRLVNQLDHTLYFITDNTSPDITISDNEQLSDGKWVNKSGAKFTISVNDNQIDPLDGISLSLSAQDSEISAALSDIYGDFSDISDISSLVIGNFTFDLTSVDKSGKIAGKYESIAYRDAKNALAEKILSVGADNLNSSFSNSKHGVMALIGDFSKLEAALNSPANVSENDLSEIRRLFNNIKNTDNRNYLKYTIELAYNKQSNDYTVSIVPNDRSFSGTFDGSFNIYAEDICGNSSTPITQDIRLDCAAPSISQNNINLLHQAGVTKNRDIILCRNGVIEVSANDTGSGIDKVLFSFGGEPDIEMERNDDGIFRYVISDEDFNGKNICVPINVAAIDKAGNKSSVISSAYNIVIDSTPPEISLSPISGPSCESMGTKWYGGYSSLSYRITANDNASENPSGISGIQITINNHLTNLTVSNTGLNRNALSNGDYYIAFEPVENSDGFRAVLRRSDSPSYSVKLYEVPENPDGKIKVSISGSDYAGNKSAEITEDAVVDNKKPHVLTISADNRNIIGTSDNIVYSIFSDKAFKVDISASDGLPSAGLDRVLVTLVNSDGTLNSTLTYKVPDNSVKSDFTADIPLNFKGYLEVEAVDRTGLTSDKVTTVGIVTEDSVLHNSTSEISIELPDTPYTDISGHPLYKKDVTARVKVSDSFSEIAKAELKASGLPTQTVTINSDGEVSGDDAENWQFTPDSNLISELSKEVKISNNSNNNKIELKLWDNVGIEGEPTVDSAEFSIDKDTPQVSVSFSNGADPEARNIINEAVNVVITVKERNFSPELAVVKVNGTKRDVSWYLSKGTEGTDSAEYRAEVLFSADGNYRVEAQVKDMCGWESQKVFTNSFIIDRTPPVVHSPANLPDKPNQTFSEPFSATFSVVDNNFNPDNVVVKGTLDNRAEDFPKNSKWIDSGDHHTTKIDFEKDGEYTINISGKDSAGNELPEYDNSFRIDSENPFIDIKDVSKANNGDVIQPRLIYTDRFLDKDSISIQVDGAKRGTDLEYSGKFVEINNGWEFVFDNLPKSKEYDDVYTITTSVKDAAGNSAMDIFQFSVNRFGSTFVLSDGSADIAGKIVQKVPDVLIRELNVDKHSDSYGVIVKKDDSNIELKADTDYYVDFVSEEPNSWAEYLYTIPEKLFEDEAKYNISVHSVDRAGNVNASESAYDFTFTVDRTPPVCVRTDLENNKVYKGKSHMFNIEFSDNTEVENVSVMVDDYVVTREFNGGICTFELPKSKQPQLVTVELTDKAGNKTNLKYNNVLVTNNFFKYTSHQAWFRIIFGTIGAGAVGAGAFVFCKKRKRKSNLW